MFQSTLPRGSDNTQSNGGWISEVSIHAPSRERRRAEAAIYPKERRFNPRSLAGATRYCFVDPLGDGVSIHAPSRERPITKTLNDLSVGVSIHAPSRERQHQNKLLLYSFKSSIFCELAQLKYSKIYFDVRKLIVSHSSLSCEPKLNFMFHITSHRIILHYFYSCQSICK